MSQEEELLEFIQKHDLGIGKMLSFKCPHCGKEVVVELEALWREPDAIEVYWGKNPEEIEDKRRGAEKETE